MGRVVAYSAEEHLGRADWREHRRHCAVERGRQELPLAIDRIQAQLVEDYRRRSAREREAMRDYYRAREARR